MKRRFYCFVLALIIVLLAIPSSFADNTSSNVNGGCYRSFKTDTILYSSGGFSHFYFKPSYLHYNSTPNLQDPSHSIYAKARPQGLDGTLYGTLFIIYTGYKTTWLPNNSGQNALSAQFKVHNADYLENNIGNNWMSIIGYISAD